MSQVIEQLQSEWNEIKAQVDEIQAEYNTLCAKRSSFQAILLFPKDNSPEAQAEFSQACQTQLAQWSVHLPELEREIKATGLRVKKTQAKLAVKQAKLYELQAKEIWPKLGEQAKIINQFAQRLEQEIQTFWQIAHNFKPRFEDWLPDKPQLAYFDPITTIPQVKQTENGLQVINKEIDFEED
ncbi:hypothetical protein M595_0613 [Lyngbya aestuarii BL J]|uniref:Uncharacterized protein n=1 Tax=Lyngbya aestuarii BL J TaxID=1348334 RepID=U7QQA8_9CYAN|nr:hypothetical protein [Lyngbya aestuarii]ERT09437.1 hypothetical protein M595_0613 [Lyngbya aestuarii BL J]